jgi:endonuclease/exonuclease/phosphatase family metal-dependent hydrolase
MGRHGGIVALAFVTIAACSNRLPPQTTTVERSNRAASTETSDERVRIVTYNVHMASASTLADVFRAHDNLRGADVVLLQEIESHDSASASEAAQLAALLGMSHAYAPGYGLDAGTHGIAILSRFAMTDIELIELPEMNVKFNSARRVAIGATLTVEGRRLRIYNVHLDNRINPQARIRQLAPVVDDALDSGVAEVVIGGDLNTSPFCWAANVMPVPCGLQGKKLERYVRDRGFDTPVVRSGPTHKWMEMRLDGIYGRGVDVRTYRVENTVRTSDHLPLWMDVEW